LRSRHPRRAAYLEEIGSAQRFAALDQADRESVLAGQVRTGMSAEALQFLWGRPFYTEGYVGHHEYWYYVESPVELADSTQSVTRYGLNLVRVYLVDGRVEWWIEVDGPYKK
jgi:outer membrane protein assembly factor BamE (lipoprotein component of BamABCDE complex)